MGLRAASLVVLVCALAACSRARTEVIVVTNTDLDVDELRVEVTGPGGELMDSVARLADEPPPRTLGLVHEGGPLGPFVVRARAVDGGTTVVERVAEFEFQTGRTLVLRMDLLARCVGESCGADETCGESGCRAITIDPGELTEWNGQAPGLDAGGGVVDSGGVDAGMDDAGMFDAGDCTAETCNMMDDDCDGMIDETFDLDTDESNCGMCGEACTFTNATGQCTGGMCAIDACDAGFENCDGNEQNGCETDVMGTDRTNCGSCGNMCTGSMRDCCDGTCC